MISNEDKVYLFLSYLDISYKKFKTLIDREDVVDVFKGIENKSKEIVDVFGKEFEDVYNKYFKFNFDRIEKYFAENKIEYVIFGRDNYLQKLNCLDEPPIILFYKGNISLANKEESIAIVGSRSPSFYAKDVTEKFAKKLCENNVCIVSGLAYGVDTVANQTAVDSGNTIAVLGGGICKVYPAQNTALAQKIAENGLLMSEYFPTNSPKQFQFIARNRIIAALCKGVLITEASQKSGSMQTKNFALDLGKDVFSVPGNIFLSKNEGTNLIIKNGHAQCVTCPEDILEYYGFDNKKQNSAAISLNFEEQRVYNLLQDGEMSFEQLQIATNMETKNLNSCLTIMQIRGIIKKLPGNTYIK